jgi:tRNA threonylcarbamoyladenosine biosynthesis protein TsaE
VAGQEQEEGLQILLSGDLGAGKTVFVKGLAQGLGINSRDVSSPTFVLANQYTSPEPRFLHHVDFYRLESFEELESMGFFDLGGNKTVLVVEWGDRFPEALNADRIELTLTRSPRGHPEERHLRARATGPISASQLRGWKDAMSSSDRAGRAPESRS